MTQLFIDGSWTDAAGDETFAVQNPATGKSITEVVEAAGDDVDAAVTAAQEASSWATTTGFERRKVLLRFAAEVANAAQSMGELMTDEVGIPLTQSVPQALIAADYLEYFAGWADKISGETIPTQVPGAFDYTIRHPVGVVAAIVSWNAPILIAVQKLAPALAAGCTVVLKPSELAPLAVTELVRCAERAGIPGGVLNLLNGGPGVGQALVGHPGVQKISYTGGTVVGRKVGAAAARALKRCTLELGGKSANIVFADADLEKAAASAASAVFINSGQQCIAGSRLLVQESVYEPVVQKVAASAAAWTVGDPRDPATMMGPVISEPHLDRVLETVTQARGHGKVILGGERLGGDLADGFFLGPTVVTDLDPSAPICQQEVFGPVLSVIPFRDEADAIRIANDSAFGLAGAVWTSNLDRAHRVARSVRTGQIWVNTYLAVSPSVPFGGHKDSGYGREGGRSAIDAYTELTNVLVAIEG